MGSFSGFSAHGQAIFWSRLMEPASPNSIARMFHSRIIQLIDASFLLNAYRFTFTAW